MTCESSLSERGLVTIQRLESALNRLIEGKPERTPNDGKLSLSRINQEAGLSSGGIYYYEGFVAKAKQEIDNLKSIKTSNSSVSGKISIDKLRAQRDKERELKERYKSQRDEIKKFCDQVIAKNANLELSLFEALERIGALEAKLKKVEVVEFRRGKKV